MCFVLFFHGQTIEYFFSLCKSMLILTVYLHYLQLNKYEVVPFLQRYFEDLYSLFLIINKIMTQIKNMHIKRNVAGSVE